MDNEKIYTKFSEIENELKKNASKHVKLQDIQHKDIIPFNKPKTSINAKINEIKKKLQNLPDGIYCLIAQDRFGKGVYQDNFYFGKGKYNKEISTPVVQQFSENSNNNNSENLLSLESAVKNIQTSADLKAEVLFLRQENDSLKKKNLELEQEVELLENVNDAMEEETPGGQFGALGEFLKEISPVLPSLADKYFEMQTQKNNLEKTKLLMENGYDIPGLEKKSSSAKKQQMPQPGTAEWSQYVEEVADLPDDKFHAHLALIERKFPELYPHLVAEVLEETDED